MVLLVAGVFGLLAVAAAVGGAPGPRSWISNGVAFAALALPPLGANDPAWVSAMIALTAAFGALTIVDLNRDPAGLTLPQRVFHVFALYDTRIAVRIAPYFDGVRLFELIAFLAVAVITLGGAWAIGTKTVGALALRWLLAAVFGYAAWGALTATVLFVSHARGVHPAPFHVRPILSRSVAEFWNRRWNRIVGAVLERTFYRPLARRRHPRFGIVATFVASATLHTYFIAVPLGARWAAVIGAFFLLQIPLVFVERALRVTRWSSFARRVWTVAALGLASPLHMEPCLQLVEPQPLLWGSTPEVGRLSQNLVVEAATVGSSQHRPPHVRAP